VANPITRPLPANAPPSLDRFLAVRAYSEQIAAPLSPEDQTVQSMPDASPTKWHLAHTTWFFETFLLRPHAADYRPLEIDSTSHGGAKVVFSAYEHLPATPANDALLAVTSAHPGATVVNQP